MAASHLTPASGVFALRTMHGGFVQFDPATGQAFHRVMPADAGGELVVFIPPGAVPAAFLLPSQPGAVAVHIDADAPVRIATLRVQRSLASAQVAFCHPVTGLYLSAGPLAGVPRGGLVINRTVAGGWEMFDLVPIEAARLPLPTQAAIAALRRWMQGPVTGPAVLSMLEAGVDPGECDTFEAFARLLTQDQIAWLGPTLLGRPVALSNLAKAFPSDRYATTALPKLSAWLATRPQVAHIHLPSDLDALADASLDGIYRSFWQACNFSARRNVPARRQVCVLATARNEGIYLLEWIAYHRSIGVEAFFLYSNDNNDGSDALLAALAQAGVITWISSELKVGSSAQPKAYGHALQLLPNILDYRWTLVIDLDEYFAFDRGRFAGIQDYIAWQEARPTEAIAFNWLVFGSGGADAWREDPLTSRFVARLPWHDPHIKTMVRTNLALHSRPHHPVTDACHGFVTRNASGAMHVIGDGPSFSAKPEADTAWINHYFLKSAEEFVWKFSRNRGDHALVRHASAMAIDPTFVDMFVSQHRCAARGGGCADRGVCAGAVAGDRAVEAAAGGRRGTADGAAEICGDVGRIEVRNRRVSRVQGDERAACPAGGVPGGLTCATAVIRLDVPCTWKRK